MRKLLYMLLIIQCSSLFAAPKSDLWEYWQAHNDLNSKTITYTIFNNFLKKYSSEVKENTLIYYSRVTKEDKDILESFISALSEIEITNYSKKVQQSYWINLYNMVTIDVVLNHYPVESIMDIKTSGFFKSGPWDQEVIVIEGKKITLNDIEHRILRPIWSDKRLHYVLNCASIGCPNIGVNAYTPENIEEMLNIAEEKFINSSKGVQIEDNKLVLSSIFKWYKSDFGSNENDILGYISTVKNKDLSGYKVTYDYNWNLNEIN